MIQIANGMAKRTGRRYLEGDCDYLPTPAEIKEGCRRIREEGFVGGDGVWRQPWDEIRYGIPNLQQIRERARTTMGGIRVIRMKAVKQAMADLE